MRNWFPFTDYDFYGYLASGFVLLFAADYVLTDGSLMIREDWAFVEVVLAVAVAYFTGQFVASPSSILLEHWLARRVLRPPTALLLAVVPARRVDRFLARRVIGRYYEPLPEATRNLILKNAAAAHGSSIEDARGDPEAVFGLAFVEARKSADTRQRMDDFRNQYGLNRNMSFTAIVASALFLGQAVLAGDSRSYLLAALAFVLALGLFARFLKFYSAFAAEILRAFAYSSPPSSNGSLNES